MHDFYWVEEEVPALATNQPSDELIVTTKKEASEAGSQFPLRSLWPDRFSMAGAQVASCQAPLLLGTAQTWKESVWLGAAGRRGL